MGELVFTLIEVIVELLCMGAAGRVDTALSYRTWSNCWLRVLGLY